MRQNIKKYYIKIKKMKYFIKYYIKKYYIKKWKRAN